MLHIVRGLPGSGKSTFARCLNCFHVEADMYFMEEGAYQFKDWKIQDAHRWCFSTVQHAIRSGLREIVVSNTFVTKSQVVPYLGVAQDHSLPCRIYHCVGNYGNTHNVPPHVLDRMAAMWQPMDGEIPVGIRLH